MTPVDYDAWLANLVEIANATPPPAPSGATTLELTAKNIAVRQDRARGPGQPAVRHRLQERWTPPGSPHDVDIRQSDGTTVVIDQQTTDGGSESHYQYQGLPPGTYKFICSVHPGIMHGTLTVK